MTRTLYRPTSTTPRANPGGAPRQKLNGWMANSWKLMALPMLLFFVLPLAAIWTRVSLVDLWDTLHQEQVIQAFTLSMVTSFATVLVTLIFGTPLAYLLAQGNGPTNRIVDTLVDLPIVLPPSVAGVALLMAFGRSGVFGPLLSSIGVALPFTLAAVIVAQTFVSAPYFIKSAGIGFSGIDLELKQAAALDGAGRWQVFRFVILPLAWSALLGGLVMTWARALGEFGATIIFAGNFSGRTQTMPLAIYIGFEIDLEVALALSIILIGLSFLSLLLVKWFLSKEPEAEPVIRYE